MLLLQHVEVFMLLKLVEHEIKEQKKMKSIPLVDKPLLNLKEKLDKKWKLIKLEDKIV